MIKTAKGLYEFWNEFQIPAYPENAVPDDAQMPYITYEVKQANWSDYAPYSVRVWYRDTSYDAISRKVDQISERIGNGYSFSLNGGFIWLFKEDSFIQMQPAQDADLLIKVAYLSMLIHTLV